MKKILFIIASFLTLNLSAAPEIKSDEFKLDHVQTLMCGVSAAYYKAMQICAEKGYNYFKFLKVYHKDALGQEVLITGASDDKNGVIIKDSIVDFDLPNIGKVSSDFEIICYKDETHDETACDVQKYMLMIKGQMPESADQFKMDQLQSLLIGVACANVHVMQMCADKGYNYFKWLKISYKDQHGQKIQIKGVSSDKNGDIIKDKMPCVDKASCDFEIICFKDDIKEETACDVQKYMQMIKQAQIPAEKIEGSKVVEITSLDQLKQEIASSKVPVFVDCYSNFCPPCKTFSPIFDKYSIERASYGKFLKVNVSDVKEIADLYQIRGVPSLLIFEKDGSFQEKKIGLPDITKYLDEVKTK